MAEPEETLEEQVARIAAKKAGKKPKKAAAKKPAKRAVGRPTKYTLAMCEAVEATARKGATMLEIAAACDVSVPTIYTWCDEHPEFLASVTRAKKNADDLVVNALFRRALGNQLNPPDTKACTIWLGNRRPDEWRDPSRVELNVGVNVVPILDDI